MGAVLVVVRRRLAKARGWWGESERHREAARKGWLKRRALASGAAVPYVQPWPETDDPEEAFARIRNVCGTYTNVHNGWTIAIVRDRVRHYASRALRAHERPSDFPPGWVFRERGHYRVYDPKRSARANRMAPAVVDGRMFFVPGWSGKQKRTRIIALFVGRCVAGHCVVIEQTGRRRGIAVAQFPVAVKDALAMLDMLRGHEVR
ncbi:MAG: hypothetical protein H5T86_01885 [Armatimonadetes bacterium]|nr:hypothetical protein [Armatimonadota bacterium]